MKMMKIYSEFGKKKSNAQYYNSVMIWYYVGLVPLVVAMRNPPAVHAHDT